MRKREVFLMICHSGIGNLVQATPCLSALRQAHPDAHIHLLTWPRSSRILEGWDVVDTVTMAHPVQFIRSLRRKPDAVLLSPAGAIWDASWDSLVEGSKVFRAQIGDCWLRHESEYMMDFARALGFSGGTPASSVHLFDSNRNWARSLVEKHCLRPFICINASYLRNEHWHMKHFGNHKYSELADLLHSYFPGYKIVFIGSKDDESTAYGIMDRMRNMLVSKCRNACGASGDIKDTAALMAASELVVGNDGGLMHVATALGIPTVTVFTFTNPIKNRPLGEKSRIVMRPCEERIRCQHGKWQRCEGNGCLDVPIKSVMDAIQEALHA